MNTNKVNVSASGERAKASEGEEKAARDESRPGKSKAGKHGNKDQTVLGEINDDSKKQQNG
ncbi:hypothetical protein [Marinobacter sp.]|uniref:hypothetical protein n=1 Tax=Marinobacter sp. TaxID=50741 RepID=UPI003566B446